MYAEAHAVWMAHKFRDNYSLWAIEIFIFCELFRWMLRSYSANVRLTIQGMAASEFVLAWVGQKIVLAVYTVELKAEGRCWKSAGMSFWPLYGERRIAFSLSSCHIWRYVVITGYDDRFREIKNRLIFRLHFLQLGNSKTITTDGNRPAPWLSSLEAL